MIELKLLTSRVGDNFSQVVGDVIDVDDAEALRMVGAGQAVGNTPEAKKQLEGLRKKPEKPAAKEADSEAGGDAGEGEPAAEGNAGGGKKPKGKK